MTCTCAPRVARSHKDCSQSAVEVGASLHCRKNYAQVLHAQSANHSLKKGRGGERLSPQRRKQSPFETSTALLTGLTFMDLRLAEQQMQHQPPPKCDQPPLHGSLGVPQ